MYRQTVRKTARFPVALAVLGLVTAGTQAQHQNRHDPIALADNPGSASSQLAPILEGLGDNHHAITTRSPRAQEFFDQGLLLTYGFNHQEALRTFKEVARLDPDAAMAYWGWALVLGPNLNLPMHADVVPQAWEAIQLAQKHKNQVSPKERAVIEALARRYSSDPEADRAQLNQAYAAAMREVHEAYPMDNDIAVIFAAALMNLSPWDYWTPDGVARDRTPEVLELLEGVIARDPGHEGALHYYIHAIEAFDAKAAENEADLLRGLAPGAGHLTHMPSHIYMQVGRYDEAYEANVLAAKADEGYITQCRSQGIYPLNYYPHNVHFLVWAASMQGRRDATMAAARKVASKVPADMHGNDWGLFQTFLSTPVFTMVRFGMWDEILKEPQPGKGVLFLQGVMHYARGLAFLRKNQTSRARAELTELHAIASDPKSTDTLIGLSNAGKLLRIAEELLHAEIDGQAREWLTAIAHADRAVRLQDTLPYNEPPDWYYPSRQTLGALLIESGAAEEAEAVYREDLKKYPANGWSLYGLRQSLTAQKRIEEAGDVEGRLIDAWADADVKLTSSRF